MSEVLILKQYARIYELGKVSEIGKQENEIRVYKNSPETIAVQIRTCKPITCSTKGISKNMIAHVSLTENDIRLFIQYAKQYFNLD